MPGCPPRGTQDHPPRHLGAPPRDTQDAPQSPRTLGWAGGCPPPPHRYPMGGWVPREMGAPTVGGGCECGSRTAGGCPPKDGGPVGGWVPPPKDGCPAQVLEGEYNATWTRRWGSVPPPATVSALWALSVAIFSVGGMAAALAVGEMADRLGRWAGLGGGAWRGGA